MEARFFFFLKMNFEYWICSNLHRNNIKPIVFVLSKAYKASRESLQIWC